MTTIVEILEAHGVPYKLSGQHHHVRVAWVGTDCVRCSPNSGRYRLGFTLDGRRANCWACGRMDVAASLAALCRLPLGQAIGLRAGLTGGRLPATPPLRGKYKAPSSIGPFGVAHARYLTARGFDPMAIARVWGAGGIGHAAQLAWRLFIPVFDELGRAVTWTTRAIRDDLNYRYFSAPAEQEEVSIKEVLYGVHLARHAVVIVEGPLDAWAIGPGALATCGVGYTAAQAALAAAYPMRAVCFDNEPVAQRRAGDLCRALAAMPGKTTNIQLDTGTDPASAAKGELAAIRREFLPEF
jgi:hypothetical protein